MQRANYFDHTPELMQHLMRQETLLHHHAEATVGITILELIKLRASQLNQCAFCIAMHTHQARMNGIRDIHIIALSAWQDTSLYNHKERAALQLCERLTLGKTIDDTLYQQLSAEFDEDALVTLTIAINAINSWNRMVKMFKPEVVFNE
ncbi:MULTISPECIES: carboxymuconolactone decarboxylase family protein [unclassified Pseudoalteromonas]|uniref:carboxymuconolactone decarboxylase family protein n=1 Tax=unclassified Pseudoalteromonas TaxID=194690 RepID=UPI0030155EDE